MADTKREIERKYESDDSGLPDLTGVAGVAAVVDKGVAQLDAVYHDTTDERLAAASITLRRRTGGSDAGWHLKFPVAPGVRDEIRAPLSDSVPLNSPASSAPGCARPNSYPWSGCVPTGTCAISWTRTAGCSPR